MKKINITSILGNDADSLALDGNGELNPGWEEIRSFCERCEQETNHWMKRMTPKGFETTSICSCCKEQYWTISPEQP